MNERREQLEKARVNKGLTQAELADQSCISRSYYCNIEAGRKEPSLDVAQRIARTLGTTVDMIFFEGDVPKRNMNSA